MAFWLIKSEPESFSWERQVAHGTEPWTGVRNYQARNNLAAMRPGDRAFFYHSVSEKRIVGIVEVVRAAYPDPTAPEGSGWVCPDVRTVGPMPRPVSLAEIKADPALADFALIRQSRLSVVPVTAAQWARLCAMGGWSGSDGGGEA
ncbi:EVE domain-containing protein [Acidomonas methanolica]|uniref:EVE domain-containing protein n=1 Tax=Acidomonas methanolica TaxID=437 RepID=UPI002119D21F|nr:EVE domain-containing protein [Acidomonas methanolica]MCQ9155462.1 EVE domain-containing protein [Acidomonas methanolica]